ncbi:MAG: AraC family ligand binding domain-containing protein, partial [Bacteroidales bacterium]|nr:AraC family ligand binding domain-containing protein [Bacteroidales bacterium]
MVNELRYFMLPNALINEQRKNPAARDLYLTETGELLVEEGTIWDSEGNTDDNLLAYCTKGEGIVLLSGEQVPVSGDQFFIVPGGETFKYYSVLNTKSRFLIARFNGKIAQSMSHEFSVVRNLVPSVNNMVANREMLFDEIFNNLSKGFYNQNIEYVNFCFGHLLATFIFANRTSDDLADESSPAIRRALHFLEKNLHKKLSLQQIAREAGYS